MNDYLVGIYYFSGWWRSCPNKYNLYGEDWRTNYPERIALLGEYNEQATMNREIAAAASHGVDFFHILWYYLPSNQKSKAGDHNLNNGIEQFMASPNNHMMKFTIEFTNHPPFEITSDEEWGAVCREWCEIMKHSRYLQVDDRPVFKIHSVYFFHQQNGNDNKRVAARLATFRKIAKKSGLPNPLISGGVAACAVTSGESAAPYDFLTTYMEMPDLPQKEELYSYEDLIKYAEDGWKRYAKDSDKPYVPYVPAGWDPRPWKDPRPSFATPTGEEWTSALKRVKSTLDNSSNLGILTRDGIQKAILIYAWNEFGEGGIVAPTKGDGEMKLEAIRSVFFQHQNAENSRGEVKCVV